MRFLVSVLAFLVSLLVPAPGWANDEYPSQPIKIIVPWPAGGVADFLGRLAGQQLSKELGQPVVVENRAGAGTNIGSDAVAKAAPDGYTLLIASSNNAVNMTLFRKMSYDTEKDFVPISLLAYVPNILIASSKFPPQGGKELIDYARSHPGKVSVATAGNGSPAHLAAAEFLRAANLDMLVVPYKGAAPAVTGLMGGETDIMFTNLAASLAGAQSGRLRIMAVASRSRIPALPDVPTIAESGLPGFEASGWYGLVAPAGTPAAIIQRINRALKHSMTMPDIEKRLVRQGVVPVISSPDELGKQIHSDIGHYRTLIKTTGIHIE